MVIENVTRRTLICPICGKEFIGNVHNKRYCSIRCRAEAKKNYDHKGIYENTCQRCGKSFTTKNPDKVFCSMECQRAKVVKKKKSSERPQFVTKINHAYECGMSYGKYTAALRTGKTYEEILAAHKAELKRLEEW